jgi:nitric oxide synthase oxygenase domain/subunit
LEDTKFYRPRVIYNLRETMLKSFDQVTVTPKDRETALIWFKNFNKNRR